MTNSLYHDTNLDCRPLAMFKYVSLFIAIVLSPILGRLTQFVVLRTQRLYSAIISSGRNREGELISRRFLRCRKFPVPASRDHAPDHNRNSEVLRVKVVGLAACKWGASSVESPPGKLIAIRDR